MGDGVDTNFETYKDGAFMDVGNNTGIFVVAYLVLGFMKQNALAVCVVLGIILATVLQILYLKCKQN